MTTTQTVCPRQPKFRILEEILSDALDEADVDVLVNEEDNRFGYEYCGSPGTGGHVELTLGGGSGSFTLKFPLSIEDGETEPDAEYLRCPDGVFMVDVSHDNNIQARIGVYLSSFTWELDTWVDNEGMEHPYFQIHATYSWEAEELIGDLILR